MLDVVAKAEVKGYCGANAEIGSGPSELKRRRGENGGKM